MNFSTETIVNDTVIRIWKLLRESFLNGIATENDKSCEEMDVNLVIPVISQYIHASNYLIVHLPLMWYVRNIQ